MLLKVGVIMLVFSLTLAAGAAATVVGFRNATPETTTVSSVEPQAAETPTKPEKKPDRSERLRIEDDEPVPQPRSKAPEPRPKAPEPRPKAPQPRLKPSPQPKPPSQPNPPPIQDPEPRPPTPAPLPVPDLPRPTSEEQTSAQEPRYYEPGAEMSLTIESLGLYSVPITSSDDLLALDTGLMHVPETSLPWDTGDQRNVFIAGHYLGYPGTNSRLVFYNLDKLAEGDEVFVEDGLGGVYEYRVRESFAASPEESWVMGQEVGRDMLTLQTCIPPGFEERLIVRADRV